MNMIGENYFEILLFFILSNKLDFGVDSFQFMIFATSPERELDFNSMWKKMGIKWIYHILHTGQKNMSTKNCQANASLYGDGIYMSNSYAFSSSYCKDAPNIYAVSKRRLVVISYVENLVVSDMKKTCVT